MLQHPNRWNASLGWENRGSFTICGKEYFWRPRVIDFYRIVRAYDTSDSELLAFCIEQTGINFETYEEFNDVIEYLFFDVYQNSRFINKHAVKSENSNQKSEKVSFDWYIDSDAIYANFVKNYGHLVKTPADLEQMDWFQFKMLFDNMASTLSDRVQLRESKPAKTPNGKGVTAEQKSEARSQKIKLKQAQSSVYINEDLRFK